MIYKIRLIIKEDPLAIFENCDDFDINELAAWHEAYPDVVFENFFEEKKKKKAIRGALAFAKQVSTMEGLTIELDIQMVGSQWTADQRSKRSLNSYAYQEYSALFNRTCEHGKKFKNFSDNEKVPW